MTKIFCHNGYCEPIHKVSEEGHSKMASIKSFINTVVILFVITLIVAFIGEVLVEVFTL